MAVYLGLFGNMHRAQEAIRQEADRMIIDYLNHGSYGRFFYEIQASLGGVIKASVDVHDPHGRVTGQTQILYTFCIRTIENHTESSQIDSPPTQAARLKDEYYLNKGQGTPFSERPIPMRTVKHGQPLATQHPPPEPVPVGVQHDEERSAEWARTRVPLFDRRNDGPFRRPSDPPYLSIMKRSVSCPTMAPPPVDQAVESPDKKGMRVDSATVSSKESPTSKP